MHCICVNLFKQILGDSRARQFSLAAQRAHLSPTVPLGRGTLNVSRPWRIIQLPTWAGGFSDGEPPVVPRGSGGTLSIGAGGVCISRESNVEDAGWGGNVPVARMSGVDLRSLRLAAYFLQGSLLCELPHLRRKHARVFVTDSASCNVATLPPVSQDHEILEVSTTGRLQREGEINYTDSFFQPLRSLLPSLEQRVDGYGRGNSYSWNGLSMADVATVLACSPPKAISWSSVAIRILNEEVANSHSLFSLNGAVVALAVCDEPLYRIVRAREPAARSIPVVSDGVNHSEAEASDISLFPSDNILSDGMPCFFVADPMPLLPCVGLGS